jgi:hypothetical protein
MSVKRIQQMVSYLNPNVNKMRWSNKNKKQNSKMYHNKNKVKKTTRKLLQSSQKIKLKSS